MKGHSAVAIYRERGYVPGILTSQWPERILAIKCAKGRGLILPGGKFEPDKDSSYRECARRELFEETGVVALDAGQIIWHGMDSKKYYCYAVEFFEVILGEMNPTKEGTPHMINLKMLLKNEVFGADYDAMFHPEIEKGKLNDHSRVIEQSR